ncbi:MAG: hypothetical protein MUO76_09195, partial [Anaerolineaceae bacterium]|nr:hypothetical protein [Anaerolineaceae bacterium]
AFGARPLRRALQKNVESPLSVKLLSGDFAEGDIIQVDIGDESQIVFSKAKKTSEQDKPKTELQETDEKSGEKGEE